MSSVTRRLGNSCLRAARGHSGPSSTLSRRLQVSRSMTPPKVPAGAWDAHMHVTEPERFRPSSKAQYKVHTATLDDALKNAERLGLPNMVLVQTSTYGFDNSGLLDTLERLTSARARGLIVVDPENVSEFELRHMHKKGVRGVRLNLVSVKDDMSTDVFSEKVRRLADIVRSLGTWCVELYVNLAMVPLLVPLMDELKVNVVVDHLGSPPEIRDDMNSLRGWKELLQLLERHDFYVKVSAPYRFIKSSDYHELELVVKPLLKARGGEGVIFASDWPHTRFEGTDVKPFLDRCLEWCDGDEELVQKLFKKNAERLFDVNQK